LSGTDAPMQVCGENLIIGPYLTVLVRCFCYLFCCLTNRGSWPEAHIGSSEWLFMCWCAI